MLTLNWEIIWTFVNILVLFFLLKFLLFKPVTNMIDKRRKLIEDQLAAASKSKKEAAEEKQSYAGMIKSANAKADKILKDAKERADQAYQYAMKQAEEDAKAHIKHGYTDEVRVIYTSMVSPIKSEPQMLKLLPLERETFKHAPNEYKYGEADFTPSPKRVMDYLVPSYIRGLLYGVMVESFSSEHNARMAAMDAATTSAKDMIRDLSLLYNRARQAAITQEITEVVSGTNGLKK